MNYTIARLLSLREHVSTFPVSQETIKKRPQDSYWNSLGFPSSIAVIPFEFGRIKKSIDIHMRNTYRKWSSCYFGQTINLRRNIFNQRHFTWKEGLGPGELLILELLYVMMIFGYDVLTGFRKAAFDSKEWLASSFSLPYHPWNKH